MFFLSGDFEDIAIRESFGRLEAGPTVDTGFQPAGKKFPGQVYSGTGMSLYL
jgi:hypothetical protein